MSETDWGTLPTREICRHDDVTGEPVTHDWHEDRIDTNGEPVSACIWCGITDRDLSRVACAMVAL
ncbi:hypothetical protein IWX78_001327 [Mycetocola sp. CAN_C7]|uniref:hypothetical protein n=1 Tax=Mycetocola sp. CAN_C7 TaxID=2787724 RepID=UPI0018C9A347